jgi:hypothetical protein
MGTNPSLIGNYASQVISHAQTYKISHVLAMRDSIGTRGMGFALFAQDLPSVKSGKSFLRVTMLSLMANPWEMLFLPSYITVLQ